MQKHEYTGLETQKKQHAYFIKRIDAFSDEYTQYGSSKELAIQITKELWRWFKEHILKVDREFGDFMRSKHPQKHDESPEDILESLLISQKRE